MKSSFKILEGGHWEKKGYYLTLSLLLPEISSKEESYLGGTRKRKVKKIAFNSGIELTENSSYGKIVIRLLGFGIELEVQMRS